MSNLPERIKAWPWNNHTYAGQWHVNGRGETTEYVRADLFDAVKAERDALEARVKALSEALEFYADESTYVTHYEREACDCCTRIFEPINEDRGETAREALQENTDETNP